MLQDDAAWTFLYLNKMDKKIKKFIAGSILGLAICFSSGKTKGLDAANLNANFSYAPVMVEERTIIDHDPSAPKSLTNYDKFKTNRITADIGLNANLNSLFGLRIENTCILKKGDLNREFGWTSGSASGDYYRLKNFSRFLTEVKINNLSFPFGFFVEHVFEEENIDEVMNDYGFTNIAKRKSTKYSHGPCFGMIYDLNKKIKLESIYFLRSAGKKKFKADCSLFPDSSKDFTISGYRLENQLELVAKAKMFGFDKVGFEFEVNYDAQKIKAKNVGYDNFDYKRIELGAYLNLESKSGLNGKLGILKEKVSSEGTYELKTTKSPLMLVFGIGYDF